jgi:plastocyanin
MRSRSRYLRAIVSLALSGALILAFTGTALAAERVRATDSRLFRPKTLSIPRHTKVVWKAGPSAAHTVTAYKGPWHKDTFIPAGGRTHFTFDRAGTYKYVCMIHGSVTGGVCSGMCGKVVVG